MEKMSFSQFVDNVSEKSGLDRKEAAVYRVLAWIYIGSGGVMTQSIYHLYDVVGAKGERQKSVVNRVLKKMFFRDAFVVGESDEIEIPCWSSILLDMAVNGYYGKMDFMQQEGETSAGAMIRRLNAGEVITVGRSWEGEIWSRNNG
jgi:hypothetical protein